MKESIGGAWIFTLVLGFIAIFTCFVSVTTNYSRCYRIKDEVLTTIAYYHGINEESLDKINTYLRGIGYSSESECPDDGNCWYGFSRNSTDIGGYGSNGRYNYCIAKHNIVDSYEASNGTKSGIVGNGPIGHIESAYYQAVVFFRLDWPIFKEFFTLDVSGETPIVYLPKDDEAITGCG